MKNELWVAVHAVFDALQKLRNDLKDLGSDDTNQDAESAQTSAVILDQLVTARQNLRNELMQLKVILAENLSEREVYLTLFPVVVYLDEAVQTEVFQVTEKQWALLQKELFDIEDGGQLFYDTLDDVLRQPETLPFILEVFYLCLNSGFKGKHSDNPVRIDAYLQMLKTRIPSADVEAKAIVNKRPLMIERGIPPGWYYAGAAVILIVAYLLFVTNGSGN